MNVINTQKSDDSLVLAKSVIKAGNKLGLTQTDLTIVIGKNNASIQHGISPKSKNGELALIFIQCYKSLFTQFGGNDKNMKHWMHTYNHGTYGIPVEQIKSIQGLIRMQQYLDIMQSRM